MSEYQKNIKYWNEPEKEKLPSKPDYVRTDPETQYNAQKEELDYTAGSRKAKHSYKPKEERPFGPKGA